MDEMIRPAQTMEQGEMLSKALRKMEDHEAIVVSKNGKYAGILASEMLLRFNANADNVKIGSVCKKGIVMQEKDASKTSELIRKFSSENTHTIVVLDSKNRIVGIVRRADVLRRATDALSKSTVSEFMEKIGSVESSQTVEKAEGIMAKSQGATELAVLEKGKFVGVLTSRNLAVKIKPYLHKKMHRVEQHIKIDLEKEIVKNILTPSFEIQRLSMNQSAISALEKTGFEDGFVFDGNRLLGKFSASKILGNLEFEEPAHIELSGLGVEEAMFKESIFEECESLIKKYGKGGALHLRVKSARKGKGKKIYEVHGRFEIDGKAYVCSTPEIKQHRENWDLSMAVSEVLDELKKSYLKGKGKRAQRD
ncbi:CBS domain-containing protein [Candidatus Micrarchaeota archaeon]|nr:CBS domain-containing protein [Candidatus Micrarchaeota archaeon]